MSILGAAGISAAGNLVGGLVGAGSQASARQDAQAEAHHNRQAQREFAQNGIRWKVGDAIAAGIHPLAALGAQTHSFSPVSVGQDSSSPMGTALSNMGQDISQAVARTQTTHEKTIAAMALQSQQLDIQGKEIDNQIRLRQLQSMQGPSFPPLASNSNTPLLTGQGNSYPTGRGTGAYVSERPLDRIHSSPGVPAQEVGTVPDYGFVQTPKGLAVVPSKDVKEKIEDQIVPETMWALRNQLLPNVGKGPKPPDPRYYPLPKWANKWKWSYLDQQFVPVNDRPTVNIKDKQFQQKKRQRHALPSWHPDYKPGRR